MEPSAPEVAARPGSSGALARAWKPVTGHPRVTGHPSVIDPTGRRCEHWSLLRGRRAARMLRSVALPRSFQMTFRMRFMPLILLLLAVAALSGASSAGLPPITVTPHQGPNPCPPTSGRQFCVDLTTHDGLARNGGIEVDL